MDRWTAGLPAILSEMDYRLGASLPEDGDNSAAAAICGSQGEGGLRRRFEPLGKLEI